MTIVEVGEAYTITDRTGYKIEVGSIPDERKGGLPDELHIKSINEGIVQVEERWTDSGASRTRRVYIEMLAALIEKDDIMYLLPAERSTASTNGEQTPTQADTEAETATETETETDSETATATPQSDQPREASAQSTAPSPESTAEDTPSDSDNDEPVATARAEGDSASGDALIPDVDDVTDDEGPVISVADDGEETVLESDDTGGSDYQHEYSESRSDAEFIESSDAEASATDDGEAAADADTEPDTADDESEFLVGS